MASLIQVSCTATSPPSLPWTLPGSRACLSSPHHGQTSGEPAMENEPRSRLKSAALTTESRLKFARPSYPGCPTPMPKVLRSMLKSTALTLSELLASPALIVPISGPAAPPDRVRLPALVRFITPLRLQL